MDAETLHDSVDTILIVDDEPLMTELFKKSMSKRGYHVLTALSGAEALQIVERQKDNIRLVLTDMSMPVMDGLTLARELERRIPAVPVILATGHDTDIESANGPPNIVSFVRKPCSNSEIAQQIRDVLDAYPSGLR